ANPTIMSTTFITITAPQKNRNAIFGHPPMGPARKILCMAEKEQQSSSSQEQGPSAYDEDRKALLVLAFMPKPEIEAFLADQGFVPPTFDKDDHQFHREAGYTQIIHAEQVNGVRGPYLEISSDEQHIFET
ncbi:MAG: hypothetical protein EZS28_048071, partial [Streblomastix strix]